MKTNNRKTFFGQLFALCIISSLFFGCGNLTDNNSSANTKSGSGNNLWVKINNSDELIGAIQTGYVQNVSSRQIETETEELEKPFKSFSKSVHHRNLEEEKLIDEWIKKSEANNRGGSRTYDYEIEDITANIGDTREIFINNNDNAQFFTAKLKAKNDKCFVWFIDNNPDVISEEDIEYSDNDFESLAETFAKIMELQENIIGTHTYESSPYPDVVNSTNQINIVVADIGETATPEQNSGTYGYFSTVDLLTDDVYSNMSNRGMYIYLDSYFYLQDPVYMYSTVVHEFDHLLVCINKLIKKGPQVNTWYTEMLSAIAEDLFQHYLGIEDSVSIRTRIPEFDLGYRYGFTDWERGDNDNRLYSNYANVYMFGAYLVRNFGGTELLHQITTNDFVDKESITEALKAVNATYTDENGDTFYVDYDYAINNFYKIILNSKVETLEKMEDLSEYLTVYKYAGDTEDENLLYFTPIDLNYPYIDKNGEQKIISPYYYPGTKKGCVDIDPSGFTIHYIDNSSFSYVEPTTKNTGFSNLFLKYSSSVLVK